MNPTQSRKRMPAQVMSLVSEHECEVDGARDEEIVSQIRGELSPGWAAERRRSFKNNSFRETSFTMGGELLGAVDRNVNNVART